MRRLFLCSFLTLCALLSGCQTMGEKFSPAPAPPENHALVYLLRSKVDIGNWWITNFQVDGKEVVSLYDSGYSWVYVKEGLHLFTAHTPSQNTLQFRANLVAGRTYYVEYTQENLGGLRYRNVVRMAPSSYGEMTVQKFSYKKANQAENNESKP